MRINFVILLFFTHFIWCQQELIIEKDPDKVEESKNIKKDSLNILEKKRKKKKPSGIFIKPMSDVTIDDYKIMYLDGREELVDTSLSLEREYSFNFLRKDYFEFLVFPNMGEAFNKLGYDFHDQFFTPQMGARVKHFSYFEKGDVPYYEVPSAYTELFFKSTFEQGQFLDSSLAINTSPNFNIAVSFRGFRSLGKYSSSLGRSRQFRISSQYRSNNDRYRMRLHQATQSIENQVNGGLTNDSVYFFENAPNYVEADETGEPVLDENGNEKIVFYDGFLDRNRLPTQIRADNILQGKRYFMEHNYKIIPFQKDSSAYKASIGYSSSLENKTYNFIQNRPNIYFFEKYDTPNVNDSTTLKSLENKLFLHISDASIGNIKFDLYHHNWKYDNGYNDYTKDTILSNSLNINRIASKVTWYKKLFGFSTKLMAYKSLNKDFSTDAFTVNLSRKIFEDFNLEASYKYRSQPLDFNSYLLESDFKEYNWENKNLLNQHFRTRSVALFHNKWGSLKGEWTLINNYIFFYNSTPISSFNEKFKTVVFQTDESIDYMKIRFDQRFDFGNFTWANNIQYQKVNQQKKIDEILGDPLALNVPEWLIRSTFMLTSSIFNNSLFFQTGATFFYFTEFYADQFNPLLSEFVTQNNTKIGNYPRVDVFFNAKIQSSRIFLKLENVSAPIKHLINIDAPYNYYSGPFVPYRDFSVRFGLIWNFFD
mgnify:FL=1